MDQNSLCTLSASIANEAVTSSIVRQMKKNIFGYTETFSWGSDEHGQMGLGKGKSGRRYSIPRFCSFGVVITSISCGYNHSAFITSNKCLYAMGSNQFNKLGLPTSIKTALQPQLVENLQHVKASKVSCGWDHSLLLSSEGEVFGWGGNNDGQLGLGSFNECSLPTKLNLSHLNQNKTNKLTNSLLGGNVIVTSISCGSYHSALLLESGQVCSFGRNNFGQLGLGDTRNRSSPVICKLDENIKMIAQGNDHSLILSFSERVLSCGQNNQGQLGLTTLSTNNSVISTYSHITALPSNISSIAAGQHSAVVTDNGQLYLFGTTPLGQFLSPQRISLLSSANITQVSIGNRFGCAVDSKGQLYTWGLNDKGQLGLGDYEQRNTPIHISSLHRKVCCGEDFIIALGRTVKPKTNDGGSEEKQKRLRSESAVQDRQTYKTSEIKRYDDLEDNLKMFGSVKQNSKKNSVISYNDYDNTSENQRKQYIKSNCNTELPDGNYFIGMDARRRINSLFSAKSFSDNKKISEQMKEQIKFQQQIQASSNGQPQRDQKQGFQQPQYTFANSAIITDESGILQSYHQQSAGQYRRSSCNSHFQSNQSQQKMPLNTEENYHKKKYDNYLDQDNNNLSQNGEYNYDNNGQSYLGQLNNTRILQQQYLEQEQIKKALKYHESTGYPNSYTETSSYKPRRIIQSQNGSYMSNSKSPEKKISSHSTSKSIKQKQLEFINSSYQDLPLNPRPNSSLIQYSRGQNKSQLDQTFDGEGTDEVFDELDDQEKDQSEYRKQLISIQEKVNKQLANFSQQQYQQKQQQQQSQLHQLSLNMSGKEDEKRRRLSKGVFVQASELDDLKIRQEENDNCKKRSDVKMQQSQNRGSQENSKKEAFNEDIQRIIRVAKNNEDKSEEMIDQEINIKKPVQKMIVMLKKKSQDVVELAEVSQQAISQKQDQQAQQLKQLQKVQPSKQLTQGDINTEIQRTDLSNENNATIVKELQDSLSPSLEVNSKVEFAEKNNLLKEKQSNLEVIAVQQQKLLKLEEDLKISEAREQRLKEEIEGQKQQNQEKSQQLNQQILENQGLKQQTIENQGLKQQILENQGKINEQQQTISMVQRQIQLNQQEYQDKISHYEVQLAAEKQLVENLRGNSTQLSHHSNALLNANTQLQQQVQYLQEQAIQQAGLISKEQQTVQSLQGKIDQQRQELEKLHAKSHYSTAQNEELKSSGQSLQHQIQSLQLDLKHLLQDQAALKEENYKILLTNEKINLQNDRIQSDNKELKRRIEELEEQNKELEEEKKDFMKEQEVLNGQLTDAERKYSEMIKEKEGFNETLSNQNEKLRRDCDKLHEQLEDVNVRLEQSEGDAEAKQQEILTLQSLLEHLELTLNQRDIEHAKQNKQLQIRLLDEESFNYASYIKQMNQREQETQELRQIIVSLESKNKELEEFLLENMNSQNNTHNVLNSSQLTGSDNFWRTQHLRQQLFNQDRLSRSSTKTDSSLFVRRNSTNNTNSNIISTQNHSPSQPTRSGSASKKLLYALSANKQNQNNSNYALYQLGNDQNNNGNNANNNNNMNRKNSNNVLLDELEQQKSQNDLALSKFERSAKKVLALISQESPERNDNNNKNSDTNIQGIIILEKNLQENSTNKQQNGQRSITEPLRLEGKENRSKSLEKRMLDFERKLKESTKKNSNQSSQTQITLN